MKRIIAAGFCAAGFFIPSAALAGSGPVETVEAFYLEAPAGERDHARFTGPALETLQRHDAMEAKGEYGCLDFSFVFDAQDFDERQIADTLDVELAEESGGTAKVVARFVNFGRALEIDWTLEQVGGEWLVSDVAQPDGAWTLSKLCR
jgi:hypothetical protein